MAHEHPAQPLGLPAASHLQPSDPLGFSFLQEAPPASKPSAHPAPPELAQARKGVEASTQGRTSSGWDRVLQRAPLPATAQTPLLLVAPFQTPQLWASCAPTSNAFLPAPLRASSPLSSPVQPPTPARPHRRFLLRFGKVSHPQGSDPDCRFLAVCLGLVTSPSVPQFPHL